jgi:cytochrome c oxidase subunit 2
MSGGSPFDPVTPQAAAISHLFLLSLLLLGAILVLVTGLVLYASFRYAERPGEGAGDEPEQVHGNRKLEIGWTIGPAVLLVVLFGLTVSGMHRADPRVPASRRPDLIVVAHRFWWELRYPELGFTTANEIHLPVGRRSLARIESADVIHSFWVPQLGRKMDAIPGHPNLLWLEPTRPGTYLGSCSEYCGAQHAWMRLRVVVESPEEYEAWARRQRRDASRPGSARAAAGAKLFASRTCVSCHTIAGTEARARVGPDLTHFASRATLGAGVLDNTPAHLAEWLANPRAVKPGIEMPDLKLDAEQVRELVAYLEGLE